MSAIKTTLAGGLFFLLPFGVLLFVIGEVLDLAMLVARPVADFFSVEDIVGIAAANVIAWGLILLVCYLAGMAARSATLSRASGTLGQTIAKIVPGYRFIRAHMEGVFGDEITAETRARPVLVTMSGIQRYGLEVSRDTARDCAVVFLPGAPDAQTGVVVRVATDRIEPCTMSTADLVKAMMFYGAPLGEDAPGPDGH